jgi:hypothetical protein
VFRQWVLNDAACNSIVAPPGRSVKGTFVG